MYYILIRCQQLHDGVGRVIRKNRRKNIPPEKNTSSCKQRVWSITPQMLDFQIICNQQALGVYWNHRDNGSVMWDEVIQLQSRLHRVPVAFTRASNVRPTVTYLHGLMIWIWFRISLLAVLIKSSSILIDYLNYFSRSSHLADRSLWWPTTKTSTYLLDSCWQLGIR